MSGLGIAADTPPNTVQPALVGADHLRWAFGKSLGFPWYGFYLYRRPHLAGTAVCLSTGLGALALGPLGTSLVHTTRGDVSSDVNLVVTDEFPPPASKEFDLGARQYVQLAFPDLLPVRHAEVRIGFRDVPGAPVVPVTTDFRGRVAQTLDNPDV